MASSMSDVSAALLIARELCRARPLPEQRTERSWESAWRQSVDRSFPSHGRPARRQRSSRPRNRHGSRAVGGSLACSQEALSPTCLVPIRHRASEPRGSHGDDDSFIPYPCISQTSGKVGQGLLRFGDYARGVRNRHRIRGAVHPVVRGHDRFAEEIANH